LTCIRVGNKQKKIDISIPKLDNFIHRAYIQVARKIYSNVYLFEKKISDLQVQKNNRELEIIVQECILTTIRESIPTEAIIRAYMDESVEEEEEVFIEPIVEEETPKVEETQTMEKEGFTTDKKDVSEMLSNPADDIPAVVPSIQNIDEEKVVTRLTFNNIDSSSDGKEIYAPKDIDRLEQISAERNLQRKMEEEEEDDSDNERIKIHMDNDVELNDVFDLDKSNMDDDLLEMDNVIDL
jgi:hypothetical protein